MPSPVPFRIHSILFWPNTLMYTCLHRTRMLRYKLNSSFNWLYSGKLKGRLQDYAEISVLCRMSKWQGIRDNKAFGKIYITGKRIHIHMWNICVCTNACTHTLKLYYTLNQILVRITWQTTGMSSQFSTEKVCLWGDATQWYSLDKEVLLDREEWASPYLGI